MKNAKILMIKLGAVNPLNINPTVNLRVDEAVSEIKIFNIFVECVLTLEAISYAEHSFHELPLPRIDISYLLVGLHFIHIGNYTEKFVKL